MFQRRRQVDVAQRRAAIEGVVADTLYGAGHFDTSDVLASIKQTVGNRLHALTDDDAGYTLWEYSFIRASSIGMFYILIVSIYCIIINAYQWGAIECSALDYFHILRDQYLVNFGFIISFLIC